MSQIAEAQAHTGDIAGTLKWAAKLESPAAKATSALASIAEEIARTR